jgi:hypothetical protein
MDDENTQDAPAPEPAAPTQPTPEPAPAEPVTPVIPEPVTPSELSETEATSVEQTPQAEPASEPSLTDEGPPIAGVTTPQSLEEQTSSPMSAPVSAPAAQTSTEPQMQSPAQPPQTPISVPSTPVASQTPLAFTQSTQFRDIQEHGRSKIKEHRQNKLEKIIEYVQKKQTITNDEVQKFVRVSDATATRYLVDLVKQGRLVREGSPRHAIYRFVR